MLENGYISLHRSLLSWEWYKDSNTARLFIHLLLIANFTDSKFEGKIIPRGSVITSIKNLAEDVGLTPSKIRTSLDKLKETGEITMLATNKFTLINIENYSKFQDAFSKNRKQVTNKNAHSQNGIKPSACESDTLEKCGFEYDKQNRKQKTSVLTCNNEALKVLNFEKRQAKSQTSDNNIIRNNNINNNIYLSSGQVIHRLKEYYSDVTDRQTSVINNYISKLGTEKVEEIIDKVAIRDDVSAPINYIIATLRDEIKNNER